MAIPNNFDFSDPGSANKSLKKISQLMQRAGQPVVSQSFDNKLKRTSGVSYREALLTLASGQTVTLRVTQTGDIFQVLLNNSVMPIHKQTDPNKAVAEIAKLADANQAAFQKTQARLKVDLPKGIKTAAPRMEVALQARVTELDTQIAERQGQITDLKIELGETALDAVTEPTEAEVLDAAKVLAETILGGAVLDSAGMGHALATLKIALDMVETNYPINIERGDIEQAQLEAECAESFRNAIAALDSAANQSDGDNPPKLDEPETPKPSHAADEAVAADAKLQYPPEPVTDAVPEPKAEEEEEEEEGGGKPAEGQEALALED